MDKWDVYLKTALKSKEDKDVFLTWVDKSIVRKLEELANDARYEKWAPAIAAAAREYFNRADVDFGRLAERALTSCDGMPYVSRIIQGYDVAIDSLLLEQIYGDAIAIKVFDDAATQSSIVCVSPYSPVPVKYDFETIRDMQRGILPNMSLRCEIIDWENQEKIDCPFNEDELIDLTAAITYSLPVYPTLLSTLKAELTTDSCKLVSAWVDPLENDEMQNPE